MLKQNFVKIRLVTQGSNNTELSLQLASDDFSTVLFSEDLSSHASHFGMCWPVCQDEAETRGILTHLLKISLLSKHLDWKAITKGNKYIKLRVLFRNQSILRHNF